MKRLRRSKICSSVCLLNMLWLYPFKSQGVPSEVFDPLVYTLCEKLLSSMKGLKEIQKEVIQSVSDVETIMGSQIPLNYGTITAYVTRAKSLEKTFARWIPKVGSMSSQETSQSVREHLSRLMRMDSIGSDTPTSHHLLMAEREALLRDLTLNALTLSIRSGALIEQDYGKLEEIASQSAQGRDLRSDVGLTNNLLMLLIHETIQMRVALTHIMGVSASDTLRHSPLLLRDEPRTSPGQGADFPWGQLS